jgi:hypothetical protein
VRRHAPLAQSQTLEGLTSGGIAGTRMLGGPATKKSKTHATPQPPAPRPEQTFREQIETRGLAARRVHAKQRAGAEGNNDPAPAARPSVRMSMNGLAHLAQGTSMTLDERADVLAALERSRGTAHDDLNAAAAGLEDLGDGDEHAGSGGGWGESGGAGEGGDARAQVAHGDAFIVGQHVMAFSREKWRAGQVRAQDDNDEGERYEIG